MKKIAIIFSLLSLSLVMLGQNRIIGGTNIEINDVPWQVSLRNLSNNDTHFCGASILNKEWVLTAAHCVVGLSANQIRIHAGTTHQRSNSEGIFVNCDRIIIHPNYSSNNSNNDIALLHLSTPLSFSSTIQPIRLNSNDMYNSVGTVAILTGWGTTQNIQFPPTPQSDVLRRIDVPIIHRDTAIFINNFYTRLNENMIPFFRRGTSAAQGDSGGPAAVHTANGYVLIGVCSWGVHPRSDNPTVYTKVSNYFRWIYENICSLSGPASVCDQATYTVENLPPGATVQWSASNNSMTLQSGQGTGNVIFSGSGEGNILAQILLQGNLLMELNQNITFYNNIPSAPNLVCNFGNTLYPNTTYMLQASSNRAKSFEWTVIGDAYFLDNGSQSNHVYTSNGYISFTTGSGNSGMTNLIKIRCIAHNPCGGSQAIIEKFSFISQYSPFTLSPNPATDVVTVQLNEAPAPQTSQGLGKAAVWPSGVCEIQLWSATSMLRSYKTDRRVFEIPVSELPAGIYFVRIIDKDGKIYTEKLIKK